MRRRGGASLALIVLAVLAAAPGASAQGPVYAATPPTSGAPYSDGQTGRFLLGGGWLYRPDPADAGIAAGYWRNTAASDGWSPVTVPNAWNAGDLSSASFAGSVGWYRRDFTVPASAFPKTVAAAARLWIVRFESVNLRATVWLNGRQIGQHTGAFLPFELDLKGLRSGVNRLTVRVDDRRAPSDLPPGPGGGWWNWGGLLREVLLRPVAAVDISQVQVEPLLPCPACAATIAERATLRNVTRSPQTVHLRGSYGRVPLDFGRVTVPAGRTTVVTAAARMGHPHLWSIADPYLYRASLSLTDAGGHRLAGWVTRSGIRQIAVTPDGRLTLNGRPLDLRGVHLHEQDPVSGGAISLARTRQLIGWARGLGATLIRSHYPLSPEFQELADRDGLLIWSEIPVYQIHSQYLALPSVLNLARATLQNNILTNGNHPSVLLWSVGNELHTPVDHGEASYIRSASALAHKLDPTRPVGMAISSWPGVPCQTAYAPLDVIGYNDYFGWYDSGGGTTDDRDALSPFLDSLRACYPTKALMVTEFGFEANRTGPVEERGTYAFQSDATAFHLGVFATKPWLSGAVYFALQDFLVEPGWNGGNPFPAPPFHQKGIYDYSGRPKPVASVVSQLFHATTQLGAEPLGPARRRR